MKLIHTADWHLGKYLKGQSLIEDQNFIINEFFKVIDDQKPDAILISGDIFDRSIPSADSVELFNETLNKFSEKNIPTLIIAGNHDSATRLHFGRNFFAKQNIFITAKVSDPDNIILEDEFGEIYFSMIPYFTPTEIYLRFSDKNSERPTYNDANKLFIDLARKKIPKNKRSVALAHVFLSGGLESESERKFVGGSVNVDLKIFNGYNYVALGHLHGSQKVSVNHIQYSGSPLKYSFSEVDHKKSATIAEINAYGEVKIEKIPLRPRRNLIIAEGKFNDLMNRTPVEDYAQIILTDATYIYETENLREVFPNFLEIKRKNHLKSFDDDIEKNFYYENSIEEQFANFFEEITKEPLSYEERMAFEKILSTIEEEEK